MADVLSDNPIREVLERTFNNEEVPISAIYG